MLDDVDTVHAEAAREMLQRHDWVTLYTNGFRYLEKAPLMYWSVAASYTAFRHQRMEHAFPADAGRAGMILATYRLGRWALGSEGGFDSGVVLATSLGPFLFTRFLIPEVLVASVAYARRTAFSCCRWKKERPSRWFAGDSPRCAP